MTSKSKLVRQNPPALNHNRKGKTPTILTDEKVETLLSTPYEWYLIASCSNWVSGVKQNIENMNQTNIRHLKDVGKFEVKQRKNDDGEIDIYCRFIKLKDVDNTF